MTEMNIDNALSIVHACKRINSMKNCDPVRMGFTFIIETHGGFLIYETRKKWALVDKEITTFFDKRIPR